jgi:hypothetical protein
MNPLWPSDPALGMLHRMMDRPNRFEIEPATSGWRVRMTRANGQIQYIGGFETKTQASLWITSEGPAWYSSTEAALDRV